MCIRDRYEKAEPLFVQANVLFKKNLGEYHPDYATSLNNLAELSTTTGQYKKAEFLHLQAIEIQKIIFGENNPAYGASLNNLAALYEIMGQYAKAEPMYVQANRIAKETLGENHPKYARNLSNLALFYNNKGQYEKAEPLFIQVKEIREKALGKEHLDYASILNNLANLYAQIGQFGKAEIFYKQAIAITKKSIGENNDNYATKLNNLALLYEEMNYYKKSEPLFIESMEIRKKILGETHPLYGQSLNNLAALYAVMNQKLKAEPLYLLAKEIRRNAFGENHTDYAASLNNLAQLYGDMDQYKKAEPMYFQATEIWKITVGENHPYYITTLANLASMYVRMGQFQKAEPLILETTRIELENLKKTFSILSEKEKGDYLVNNISLSQKNINFLFNYRNASSPILISNFNLQIFFKSLSLADTRNMLESVNRSNDSGIQKIFKEWQGNKSILAKQYSIPIDKRMLKLDSIEAKAETLEKELTRRSSEFRMQQKAISISMPDVQKGLQQDEVTIEFVRFKLYNRKWTDSTIYAAYILKKNDSIPLFIPLCEEKQMQNLFDSAGATATTMVNSFYRGVDLGNTNNSSFLGTALYKLIWEPLEPYIKGIKKVSYSPAGKLFSVAFQALSVDSNTVLMDEYDLQQYTSTRQVALRTEEKQNIKPTKITLFGNANFTINQVNLLTINDVTQNEGNAGTVSYTFSAMLSAAVQGLSLIHI